MRVVAVNGSPNKEKGNTALILNPFLDGMRKAGAETELFYITDRKISQRDDVLEIRACRGCHNCWFTTPGECPQNDGMKILLPKLRDADIWVIASPIHADGVTGPIMTMMSRTLPFLDAAQFGIRKGHCRYALREGVKRGKIIFVSNCGFWEMDNFDPALAHIKGFAENVDREFIVALLRPHGPLLTESLIFGKKDVFRAAEEAGKELILEGKICQAILERISKALLPKSLYILSANYSFKRKVKKAKK